MRKIGGLFRCAVSCAVMWLSLAGGIAWGVPLFEVSSTTPPPAASGVTPYVGAVTALFSLPVDPATVTESSFSVSDANGQILNDSGSFSIYKNGSVVSYPLNNALPPGDYTVSIDGVTYTGGTPLQGPYSWTFSTTAPPASPNFESDLQTDGVFVPYREHNVGETWLIYENIIDQGGQLSGYKNWYYQYDDWYEDGYQRWRYVLDSSGSWQGGDDSPSDLQVISYNSDGSLLLQSSIDSHQEALIPEESDITGQPVNSYLPLSGMYASSGTIFPEGSRAYRLTYIQQGDSFEVDADTSLYWYYADEFMNIYTQNVSTLSEIPANFATGGANYLRRDSYVFQLGSDNTVTFFEGTASLPVQGSWEYKTVVNGNELLVVYFPDAYQAALSRKGDTIFAAVGEGTVYQGLWHHAGEARTAPGYVYNSTAFYEFLNYFASVTFSAYATDTQGNPLSVADSFGNPLRDARVELVGNPRVFTSTDPFDGGWFTIPGLPYQTPFALKIEMPGYVTTYTANITAESGGTVPNMAMPAYAAAAYASAMIETDLEIPQEWAFILLTPDEYAGLGTDPGTGVILGRPGDLNDTYLADFPGVNVTAVDKTSGAPYSDITVDPDTGSFMVRNVPAGATAIVTLSQKGWVFTPVEFTVHADAVSTGVVTGGISYTLSVSRAGTGSGSVSSSPAGIDLPASETGTSAPFQANSQVTLTATPEPGSVFNGWGGACSGYGTGTCDVYMYGDQDVTAEFMAMAAKPAYLNIHSFNQGTGGVYLISAPSPTPGAGYVFEYSTDGGTNWTSYDSGSVRNPTIILPTIGATYVFRVSVTASGYGQSDYTNAGSSLYYSDVAVKPAYLNIQSFNPATGGVYLISAPSPAPGANYIFEYKKAADTGWTSYNSGTVRNPTIMLPTPGTYDFRVYVTANGYVPSGYTNAGSSQVYSNVALKPAYLNIAKTYPAAGMVYLIAAPSATPGATYVFEYSTDNFATFTATAASAVRNPYITVPSVGLPYSFRVKVIAGGYVTSGYTTATGTFTH